MIKCKLLTKGIRCLDLLALCHGSATERESLWRAEPATLRRCTRNAMGFPCAGSLASQAQVAKNKKECRQQQDLNLRGETPLHFECNALDRSAMLSFVDLSSSLPQGVVDKTNNRAASLPVCVWYARIAWQLTLPTNLL